LDVVRGIPISVHSALEVFAAPLIMVAPFVFGFGPAATALAVLLGVLLLGLALQLDAPSRTMPLRAHAGFDHLLALAAVTGGIAVGVVADEWNAAVFLAGIGVALVALSAATRFSTARSA
jgi:hypothetical protein